MEHSILEFPQGKDSCVIHFTPTNIRRGTRERGFPNEQRTSDLLQDRTIVRIYIIEFDLNSILEWSNSYRICRQMVGYSASARAAALKSKTQLIGIQIWKMLFILPFSSVILEAFQLRALTLPPLRVALPCSLYTYSNSPTLPEGALKLHFTRRAQTSTPNVWATIPKFIIVTSKLYCTIANVYRNFDRNHKVRNQESGPFAFDDLLTLNPVRNRNPTLKTDYFPEPESKSETKNPDYQTAYNSK